MHTDEYVDLVTRLDDADLELAEDAKWQLIEWGDAVVADVLRDARSMSMDGQLFAVDIAQEVGNATAAGSGLIALLSTSASEEVRRAAAIALGSLRIDESVPTLATLHDSLVQRRLAPQSAESAAVRWALTVLGVRMVTLPAFTRSLRQPIFGLEWVWPANRLTDVLVDLAAHDQVVLEIHRYHQMQDGSVRAVGTDNSMWHYDHQLTWPAAVSQSHAYHQMQIADLVTDDVVVTLSWIDRTDV